MFKENFSYSFMTEVSSSMLGSESFGLYSNQLGLDPEYIESDLKMALILNSTLMYAGYGTSSIAQGLCILSSNTLRAGGTLVESLRHLLGICKVCLDCEKYPDVLTKMVDICKKIDEQSIIVLDAIDTLKKYVIENNSSNDEDIKIKVSSVKEQLRILDFVQRKYRYGFLLGQSIVKMNLHEAYNLE